MKISMDFPFSLFLNICFHLILPSFMSHFRSAKSEGAKGVREDCKWLMFNVNVQCECECELLLLVYGLLQSNESKQNTIQQNI